MYIAINPPPPGVYSNIHRLLLFNILVFMLLCQCFFYLHQDDLQFDYRQTIRTQPGSFAQYIFLGYTIYLYYQRRIFPKFENHFLALSITCTIFFGLIFCWDFFSISPKYRLPYISTVMNCITSEWMNGKWMVEWMKGMGLDKWQNWIK